MMMWSSVYERRSRSLEKKFTLVFLPVSKVFGHEARELEGRPCGEMPAHPRAPEEEERVRRGMEAAGLGGGVSTECHSAHPHTALPHLTEWEWFPSGSLLTPHVALYCGRSC